MPKKQLDFTKDKEFIGYLKGKVAVYIDAANLEQSVKELGYFPPKFIKKGAIWRANKNLWWVDYKKLYRFFKQNTKIIGINFYSARFETESHDNFLTFLKKTGYHLVTKKIKKIYDFKTTITRKCRYCGVNNEVNITFKCNQCKKINDFFIERKADFDVEISTDAVDWLQNYDTFVLFSGDSDFIYLIAYLKRKKRGLLFYQEEDILLTSLEDQFM